jgi:hypothetical protein
VGHDVFLDRDNASVELIIHEMGHVLDNSLGPEWAAILGGGAADDMARDLGGSPRDCVLRFDCASKYVGRSPGSNQYGSPRTYWTPTEHPRSFHDDYARMGPAEDFAEAFKFAVMDSGADRPQRVRWMRDLISMQVDTRHAYGGSSLQFPVFSKREY